MIRCFLILLAVFSTAVQALPVVPGAGGYGMDTPAGRGGTVYKVTNLNASGSGSLDACLDASGPRVCIFEISGTIDLNGSTLRILNPYITVAGQTAPFPGIQIKAGFFDILTHDVLVQHLRIRTGRAHPLRDRSTLAMVSGSANAVYNVVADHNTIGWNSDEGTIAWKGSADIHDITFWRQLSHPEIIGWEGGTRCWLTGANGYNITFAKSIAANFGIRSPMNAGADNLIVVNNLIYNWDVQSAQLTNQFGAGSHDNSFVGNHWRRGPMSPSGGAGLPIYIDRSAAALKLHLADNIAPDFSGSDQWDLLVYDATQNSVSRSNVEVSTDRIAWPTGLAATVIPGNDVLSDITDKAGAFPASRDAQETRVIDDILKKTFSSLKSNESQLGGFPTYAVNTRTLTVPDNPSSDHDGDGYTNLEEWLHCFAGEAEGVLPQGSCAGGLLFSLPSAPGLAPAPPSDLRVFVR